MMVIKVVSLCVLMAVGTASAADLYVNNVSGDDQRNGLSKVVTEKSGPLKTVAKAVSLARPGDTIHLEPTAVPYQEEVVFRDKGGEPGKPITLDGHGAVFDGSEPCPAGWQKAGEKLWRLEGVYSRNALVVDDRLVIERKYAADLEPGQFCLENTQFEIDVLFFRPPANREVRACAVEVTWAEGDPVTLDPAKWKTGKVARYKLPRAGRPVRVKLDGVEVPLIRARDHLEPGQWCMDGKDLYYLPPEGKEPSQFVIRKIVRGTGVSLAGKMGHLVIKNMNVRFVWNDAYNIHGEVIDAVFINCNARDCFDEGFSSHDRCETVLDGAVYERCDNGVFNVNEGGWSVTRNLVVRESRHYGFGVAVVDSEASHWLENAVLEDNPVPLIGRYLEAYNVSITSREASRISVAGPISLDQTTVRGGAVTIEVVRGSGALQIRRSILAPDGLEIVFTKATEVMLDSVAWNPATKILPRAGGTATPLADWLSKLEPKAVNCTMVADGTPPPAGIGYQKKP